MPVLSNPARLAIPAARIADCLLHPCERYDYDGKSATYPDIRLVYRVGGNPFHHHQDLSRLRRAWRRPETIIVHERWWTATARHADIVLPATTSLERTDLGGSPRDRFVIAMYQAIEPVGNARNDFDIFLDLSRRLGCEGSFAEGRDEALWLRHIWSTFREHAQMQPGAGRFLVLPAKAGIQGERASNASLLGWTARLRHRMCQAVRL
jgi:biotin/methionine sulfoxide reductase